MATKKSKSAKSSKKAAKTAPAKKRVAKKPVPAPKKKSSKGSGKKDRSERNKGMFFSLLAAASMGYLEATGLDKKIPQVETLGASGTLAAAGLAYGIYAKNRTAENIGLGYAAISAYKLGFGFGAPVTPGPTATKGDYSDVSAIPAGAMLPNGTPVLGVDPRLLSEAAATLEDLSGDLDDDDDADVSGDDDDDDDEISGDDEDDDNE